MLVDDMDISRLMVFAQQIEEFKIKKEKKRSRMDNDGSNEHGRSKIDKSFPDKVTLVLLCMRMRGCLTLDLKGKAMIILDLLALGVVGNMR